MTLIWLVLLFLKESDNEKGGHQSSGEESDHDRHNKGSASKNQHSRQVSPPRKRAQSSDEEEEEKTEEEKQQELVSLVKSVFELSGPVGRRLSQFPKHEGSISISTPPYT